MEKPEFTTELTAAAGSRQAGEVGGESKILEGHTKI